MPPQVLENRGVQVACVKFGQGLTPFVDAGFKSRLGLPEHWPHWEGEQLVLLLLLLAVLLLVVVVVVLVPLMLLLLTCRCRGRKIREGGASGGESRLGRPGTRVWRILEHHESVMGL